MALALDHIVIFEVYKQSQVSLGQRILRIVPCKHLGQGRHLGTLS